MGKSLRERLENDEIRRMAGAVKIAEVIRVSRLRWCGHELWMDDREGVKRAWEEPPHELVGRLSVIARKARFEQHKYSSFFPLRVDIFHTESLVIDLQDYHVFILIPIHKKRYKRLEKLLPNEYTLRNIQNVYKDHIRPNNDTARLQSREQRSKEVKKAIFEDLLTPIMTYGSENWTLTSRDRSRVQASEMKTLRAILHRTRREIIRNEEVRGTVAVVPMMSKIEKSMEYNFHSTVQPRPTPSPLTDDS
ncbi:uncharacterized protein [Palaemon carinicauda]|uniref:uncharacterized protein n=1 Tax=Palaemon carinicauda TaxID=392227 RepID=UPI0035B618AB